MKPVEINDNVGIELEQAETGYWRDYFNYAPEYLRNKIGVNFKMINGAFIGTVSKVDILAFNRVLGFGIESGVDENQIESIIDFYRQAGVQRFFLPVNPFAGTILTERLLEEYGFTYHNNWAKFYKKLSGPFPTSASDVEVVSANTNESKIFDAIIKNSFEWQDDVACLFSTTMGKLGWKHYFAKINNQKVGAAAMYYKNGYASLAIAGTLPGYRGAGVQGALITTRLNDAFNAGCKYVVVETAEDKPGKPSASNRNMKRFGFELAYLRKNYIYYIENL